jgi:hypothetical protein
MKALKFKVKVTLRLTVFHSVGQPSWCRESSGAHAQTLVCILTANVCQSAGALSSVLLTGHILVEL